MGDTGLLLFCLGSLSGLSIFAPVSVVKWLGASPVMRKTRVGFPLRTISFFCWDFSLSARVGPDRQGRSRSLLNDLSVARDLKLVTKPKTKKMLTIPTCH